MSLALPENKNRASLLKNFQLFNIFAHNNSILLILFVKYMVSVRCKMVVKSALDDLGLDYNRVDLGEVDIKGHITTEQRTALSAALTSSGLELMEDKKAILIERIKAVVIEMVHYEEELPKVNFSTYISEKLDLNYTYLANLFSDVTGITIERYIITHKIERVKELLLYDELTLTEISYRLDYSSVAHLSNQFKKITGLTPTFYRNMKHNTRASLSNL